KAPTGQASRFVQAKALSSREDAQKFADRVKNSVGLQAFVRKTKRRNPPLYRVIIPAFSRQDIQPILQSLRKIGVNDAFVTRQ
ncbi:MAG: SPOR domain-containing protein, partial [Parvibaculales bacterium]